MRQTSLIQPLESNGMGSAGTGLLQLLLEVAAEHGVGERQLVACDPSLTAILGQPGLAQPGARVPIDDLLRVCSVLQRLLGHRAIGVDLARRVRPATFNALGYALMTCATLGEAIALAAHFRQLIFDLGYSRMGLEQARGLARLSWEIEADGGGRYSPLLAEALLAAWTGLARWMAGAPLPLIEVHFAHPASALAARKRYGEFFGCPVRFGARRNALGFDAALLGHPLRRADAGLHLAMREEARAALRRLARRRDDAVSAQVRRALVPGLPKCETTLAQVAHRLGIAPRSLQRRLAADGTSFQQVLDDLRQEWATIYLRDSALSLREVSLLLGYAEQSSFTRAFRGWSGDAPLEWRKARCGEEAPGRGAGQR